MGLGEELFENVSLRVEGSESDSLPRRALLKIHRLGLAHSIDHEESVLVPQDMLAGPGYECEMCVRRAVGLDDLLGLDG